VRRRRVGLILFILIVLGILFTPLAIRAYYWLRWRLPLDPAPLPSFPAVPAYTPWPTPRFAEHFDFPLQPAQGYGPYVPGVTGPLITDTRYGANNPAMGNNSNCFRDVHNDPVPFSELYHAGIDLFALNSAGEAVWGQATHAPVHAVADGLVVYIYNAGSDGYIVITEHLLVDRSTVDSVYWHLDHLQVQAGQPVSLGQVIGVVLNQGFNSHLHWEIRTFRDASAVFPMGTAGARGSCNGRVTGVGYTWDDDPERARPEYYGYLDPVAFVLEHQ
jgi:murein DD-endopeptidase MepM/ murein hydrolase activator NlpD